MAEWNGFKGAAKPLDDIDLPRIGHTIGVGEDEIHAFMDVEASGSGFDSKGRPKMLFEPHVFYRNLSGSKRDKAVAAGLAYQKWRKGNYPPDSYPRLTQAMAIDETAALKAASWGLGQILGENHKMVGYPTVQAMVRAFMEDEETHLQAMVAFIIASGIDDDLRAHRWEVVARVYNGPKYAAHNYHGRMRDRFAWWQRKRDTPWSPQMPAAPGPEAFKPATRPPAGIAEPFSNWFKRTNAPEARGGFMDKFTGKWGLVLGLGGVLLGAGAASSNVDLGNLWDGIAPIFTEVMVGLILAVVAWASAEFKRKTGYDIEARHREALHSAIVSGVNLGVAKFGSALDGKTVDVQNPIIAEAINYAARSVPDALKHFGIGDAEMLRDLAAAKAQQVLGITAPSVSPPVK